MDDMSCRNKLVFLDHKIPTHKDLWWSVSCIICSGRRRIWIPFVQQLLWRGICTTASMTRNLFTKVAWTLEDINLIRYSFVFIFFLVFFYIWCNRATLVVVSIMKSSFSYILLRYNRATLVVFSAMRSSLFG